MARKAESPYNENDWNRNQSGGFSNGEFDSGEGGSFDYQSRNDEFFESDSDLSQPTPVVRIGVPTGYRHKCEGCSKGLCKSRKLPESELHDISDGNTVSTRASVVTDSSVDKGEFIDRDEDFDGFEEDEEVVAETVPEIENEAP